ncbi:MAG: type II secretion system major pseudopilin GspG [Pseudohongiellaceae bacterium]
MHNRRLHQAPPIRQHAGFTLIEILAVMVIIGLLAVMVAPNLIRQQAGAQRDAAAAQLARLDTAISSYYLDMNSYPQELQDLVENPSGRATWNGPYIRGGMLQDPWGNDWVFELEDSGYSLFSYGRDGQSGGEGDDADIQL